jgi:hypothetical protein
MMFTVQMIKRTAERNVSMAEREYDVEEGRAVIGGSRSDWR